MYLNMDNAGGHGTGAAIRRYRNELLVNHDVVIAHQLQGSHKTNEELHFFLATTTSHVDSNSFTFELNVLGKSCLGKSESRNVVKQL